jgi:thioredoxin 1
MPDLRCVSDKEFLTAVAEGLTLTFFWAPWSRPCKAMLPALEQAAKELEGRVKVLKLDVEGNPATPASLGVGSIPALMVFKNGMPMRQAGGLGSASIIRSLLDPFMDLG